MTERYVALLRGVNVSGKNKVFSSDASDRGSLANGIESMLCDRFGLDVPVFAASQEELEELLSNALAWWGSDGRGITTRTASGVLKNWQDGAFWLGMAKTQGIRISTTKLLRKKFRSTFVVACSRPKESTLIF